MQGLEKHRYLWYHPFCLCSILMFYLKDKIYSSGWLYIDPFLDNPMEKKVMIGNKFHRVLPYLHMFYLSDQPWPHDDNYSPTYNIQEFQVALEKIFNKLFIPGENLSLHESLIHQFVSIKSKARTVTRYLGVVQRPMLLQIQKLHFS